jgi:hypothetical protein
MPIAKRAMCGFVCPSAPNAKKVYGTERRLLKHLEVNGVRVASLVQ